MAQALAPLTRKRISILLSVAVGIAILLPLTYKLCAQQFLNSDEFKSMLNTSPHTRINFTHVRTQWPGKVSFENFELQDQDHNVKWILKLDKVSANISIVALLWKTLKVTALEAHGGTFYLKHHTVTGPTSAPVPELTLPPPKKGDGPQVDNNDRFTFDVAHLQLHNLRSLWVDNFEFLGSLEVTGAFFLSPKKELQIYNSSFTVTKGQLKTLGKASFDAVDAIVHLSSKDYFPSKMGSWEVFDTFTTDLNIKAAIKEHAFLNYFVRKIPWLKFTSFRGKLSGQLKLKAGRFDAATNLQSEGRLEMSVGQQKIKSHAHLQWMMLEQKPVMDIAMTKTEVFQKSPDPVIEGERLSLQLKGNEDRLLSAFEDSTLLLKFPALTIVDMKAFNVFLPNYSKMMFEGGQGLLSGKLSVSTFEVPPPGDLVLRTRKVRLRYKDLQLLGDLDFVMRIQDTAPGTETFDIKGSHLSIFNLSGSNSLAEEKWFGDVDLESGILKPSKDPLFRGRVKVKFKNMQPLLELYEVKEKSEWASNMLQLKNLEGAADITLAHDLVDVANFSLTTNRMNFLGRLRFGVKVKKALTLVEMKLLNIGLKLENNETEIKIFGSKEWFESHPPYPDLKFLE